ncbi:hypothetical protein ACFQ9F_31395, partial [Bacillus cereus]
SITEFAASLPEGANIALRVYGHKGTEKEKDKELSCSSNELIYDMQAYEQNALQQALSGVNPAGWTPLADAIEQAKNDLSQYNSESNTNIIYLVSDGIETCNGDPIAKAKELAGSNIQPIVNVIGFDVDSKGQQQLKEVAEAAKGIYENARNAEELKQQLQKAKDVADKWKEWKEKSINTANSNRLDQFLKNIPAYHIEWMEANRRENLNFSKPLIKLRDEGHISRDAYQQLIEKVDQRFSTGIEIGDQIREDLRALAEKNFEDAEKEINEIYRKYRSIGLYFFKERKGVEIKGWKNAPVTKENSGGKRVCNIRIYHGDALLPFLYAITLAGCCFRHYNYASSISS